MLAGLGTVWILDGLEVTIVGAVGSTLTKAHSGISISTAQIGDAAGVYVAGACLGALVFGYLTDKLGRKKLFLVTLGVYLLATVLTGVSTNAWMFFAFRFFTGMGIGGEYAAINSAIDELIPARVRGTVDLVVNGSYWLGTAGGAAATLVLLDPKVLAVNVGWRVCFLMGAVLGLAIMFVRRTIPESPRWLMTHGRVEEADRIVAEIEDHVASSTGQQLREPDPNSDIEIKPQESVGLLDMARTVFGSYPKRTVLGLSLFVGQAFLYNAVFFTYALVLTTFYQVDSASVGYYLIAFAVGNFLGPLLLGRLFDNVGRRPMIAGTYILSGVMLAVTAWLFDAGTLTATTQTIAWVVIFFFASAGASSAYLTVSEIYPMETRAIAIALFYAVGTGLGGIIGPVLFGHLIATKHPFDTAMGYLLGGALMFAAGVVEIFLGIDAEQKSLEEIAAPITSEASEGGEPSRRAATSRPLPRSTRPYPFPAQSGRFGRYDLRPGSTALREIYRAVSDREIDAVVDALRSDGPATISALAARLGARYWGPGRLREVVREAQARGLLERRGHDLYALQGN
ncbi:MAG TPA: MFS transporter [Mycobacteriales bacterium]|nr:MFS transporter [Mycobacteriales bacterium]